MNIYMDTRLMRDAGNDINALISQMNDNINNIYDKLININQNNWKGKGADAFSSDATKYKLESIEFINKLKEYSNYLIATADMFEHTINDSRR